MGGWLTQSEFPRIFGDVNGDGKDDMCYFGYTSGCLISNGRTGFSLTGITFNGWFSISDTSISPTWYSNFKNHPRWVADVDGDGCGDMSNYKLNKFNIKKLNEKYIIYI